METYDILGDIYEEYIESLFILQGIPLPGTPCRQISTGIRCIIINCGIDESGCIFDIENVLVRFPEHLWEHIPLSDLEIMGERIYPDYEAW